MIKAYFIFPLDVQMTPAKRMIQVAHGTDFIHTDFNIWTGFPAPDKNRSYYAKWMKTDRRKIVLQIETAEKLENIIKGLEEKKIPHHRIIDKGFTEFEGETLTGIVIYPIEDEEVPKNISRLRLFKETE